MCVLNLFYLFIRQSLSHWYRFDTGNQIDYQVQ